MSDERNSLGKQGELDAVKFLENNDFTILETNYRFGKIEIDIIAQKSEVLHFIEVKSRTDNYAGNPQDFITNAQQKRIIDGAQRYITERDLDYEAQFDVISILYRKNEEPVIEYIDEAFYPTI